MIDTLVVLGDNLFGPSLSVGGVLTEADRLDIDAVIAAPARGGDYALPLANDRLHRDAGGNPRVHRLARVDPNQGDAALHELRRCVTQLGCVGLYLDPDQEVFRVQDAAPVVALAAELGVPVVIVAGVPNRSEPLQVLDLATSVPAAVLLLTSGGQINISGLSMVDAWAALTAAPNISVLSNGEYRQDFLERVARELGPERLLFASFAPSYDQAFEVARIRSAVLDPDQRALVEHGNAARLFRIAEAAAAPTEEEDA
jgi:predicted TIM-barrel fold metal-dependent hydrolase